MILSASRRTDIPAFHTPWFLERLRAGFACVPNPYTKVPRRVSLLPEELKLIVFWTKDARPLEKRLSEIEERLIPYIFLYTLTGYGENIEPGLKDTEGAAGCLLALSDKLGPGKVIWRYDPLILTGQNGASSLTADWHIQNFETLARKLEGRVTRCITSLLSPYRRIRKNLNTLGWIDPPPEETAPLLSRLAQIAASRGIEMQTCATPAPAGGELFAGAPLPPPRPCIDAQLLSRVLGLPLTARKDKNQRKLCLCSHSVDIGAYGTCGHHCVYCYAGSAKT